MKPTPGSAQAFARAFNNDMGRKKYRYNPKTNRFDKKLTRRKR